MARAVRELFSLGEKIILYGPTNTYMARRLPASGLGQRGHSKDKRSDRPRLTLALVLDGDGPSKAARVFLGNVSDPRTLLEMVPRCRRR